jgi:hypothetical protein
MPPAERQLVQKSGRKGILMHHSSFRNLVLYTFESGPIISHVNNYGMGDMGLPIIQPLPSLMTASKRDVCESYGMHYGMYLRPPGKRMYGVDSR